MAGLGLKTITNYEKGSTYPQNREVYATLAFILDCDTDYLHNEGDDFIGMAQKRVGWWGGGGAVKTVVGGGKK